MISKHIDSFHLFILVLCSLNCIFGSVKIKLGVMWKIIRIPFIVFGTLCAVLTFGFRKLAIMILCACVIGIIGGIDIIYNNKHNNRDSTKFSH